MATRQIREFGDPCLEKVCKPVKEVNKRTLDLIDDMLETMYADAGVGHSQFFIGSLYFDVAVLTVILDRIIQKVIYQLTDLRPVACDDCAFSDDCHSDTAALRLL